MHEEPSHARRSLMIGATAVAAAVVASSSAIAAQTDRKSQRKTGALIGKRALVTGASRGIGASIALALADEGADVAITYLKSTGKATAIASEITARGGRSLAIQADAGDPAAVKRSVNATVAEFGGLDILVNNVGTARMGAFTELTLNDINALWHVNVRSAQLAIQAAIPHLGKDSRIITTGSNAAERAPFSGIAGYGVTKAALLGLTRHLARELGPRGITVNLVQPGPTDTDLNPDDGGDLSMMNRRLTSLGRYGKPTDIASVVAFLASPASAFMTGSIVTVDGGYNA